MNNNIILITGSCGFIGSHLSEQLLKQNYNIIGIDNMNDIVYDSKIKYIHLNLLNKYKNYFHISDNIEDKDYISMYNPNIVIHLAAYANVRLSNKIPDKFIENNIEVTCKLLENIKKQKIMPLFIYASSSSIYGKNKKVPFCETDSLNNICSVYALSKKMSEEIVEFYCNNYKLKAIGLRFFTVYGPRGRQDMAIHKFLKHIHEDKEIIMYGDGTMERDFTYIDDIVQGIINCFQVNINNSEHKLYNLGNNKPIKLKNLIELCGKICNKTPKIKIENIPTGEVPITYADIDKAKKELNYSPKTLIEEGLQRKYKNDFCT